MCVAQRAQAIESRGKRVRLKSLSPDTQTHGRISYSLATPAERRARGRHVLHLHEERSTFRGTLFVFLIEREATCKQG